MNETTNNKSSDDLAAEMTVFCQERIERRTSRSKLAQVATRTLVTVSAALLVGGGGIVASMLNKNWTNGRT